MLVGHKNSFFPRRCGSGFKSVMFENMLRIKFMNTSCEIAHMWMPQNIFDDESTFF